MPQPRKVQPRKQKRWLVYVRPEYVDGCAYVNHSEGEMGGDGYTEIDPTELIVGRFFAPTKEKALKAGADYWDCNTDVLDADRIFINQEEH